MHSIPPWLKKKFLKYILKLIFKKYVKQIYYLYFVDKTQI